MKGQTRIELRDAASGRLAEVHEDSNMMTNAIRDYFANMGLMNNLPMQENSFNRNQLVERLLGGIMLFDDTIPEQAGNVFPPAGINMVANGALGVTNNTATTEMGSYAQEESGWQADGSFVQTYDFTTAQGNGTIACCCLTSNSYGVVGDGNYTSKTKKATDTTMNSNRGEAIMYGSNNQTIAGNGYGLVIGVDPVTSTLKAIDYYSIWYDASHAEEHYSRTGKLKINTYKIPLSILNLNVKRQTAYKVSSTEVTVPQGWIDAFATNDQHFVYYSDQHLYIYKFKNRYTGWSDQYPFYCLRIDMSNNLTFFNPSNTTGKTNVPISNNDDVAFFHGDYMYMCFNNASQRSYKDTSKVYKINMSTSASTEIDNPCGVEADTVGDGFGWKRTILRNDGGVIVNHKGRFDLVNGVFVPNNCYREEQNPYMPVINAGTNRIMRFSTRETNSNYAYDTAGVIFAYRGTDYIASINNLETPVVKDSSKTMKVTYRITF